jgi:hypothetical protein
MHPGPAIVEMPEANGRTWRLNAARESATLRMS